jgi:peptidoglycan/LPS O-acetylase OafA/YrhL
MRPEIQHVPLKEAQSVRLDAARGIAALIVVIHHVRKLTLVPREDVAGHLSIPVQAFYWISSFANAHDAVIVFFVLSGYLVGGSVFRSLEENRWSWKAYSVDRLTRLYIVLIPALLATALLDHVALRTPAGAAFFHDSTVGYQSGNLPTFLGNFLFLQKIYCAPFGSNFSLWSLSFEFWYYLAFPLLALGIFRPIAAHRRVAWIFLGVVACFLMRSAAWLFPVWLLGSSLYYLKNYSLVPPRWCRPLLCLTLVTMIAHSLVAARLARISPRLNESAFSLLALLCVYLLLQMPSPPKLRSWYVGLARYVSSRSYTFYLVHAPVIVALIAITGHRYSQPSVGQIGLCWIIFLGVLGYGEVMYRLFEAQTPRLRKYVYARLGIRFRQPHSTVTLKAH